jgi:hypothetical protein
MRPFFVAATALAIVCACGAYTPGPPTANDGGPPIGGGLGDGGDAGPRDGGDAGPVSDAGCTLRALNTTSVIDNCLSQGLITGSLSVNPTNCSASLTAGTLLCNGTAHGAQDAFNGACNAGYAPCTSPSLPGIITCTTGPSSSCQIVVCDAGAACP